MLHTDAALRGHALFMSDVQQSAGISSTTNTRKLATSAESLLEAIRAKFYYAIWSQTGPKLVADLQRAGIWHIISLASSELARASRSATSLEPVCDQLWTCLRPASNMSTTRFELSRHVEIARTCSNLVADRLEAKFHYAICSKGVDAAVGQKVDSEICQFKTEPRQDIQV